MYTNLNRSVSSFFVGVSRLLPIGRPGSSADRDLPWPQARLPPGLKVCSLVKYVSSLVRFIARWGGPFRVHGGGDKE